MDLTAVFVAVDDYCQSFDAALDNRSLEIDNNDNRARPRRLPCLRQSEIMTIISGFNRAVIARSRTIIATL